MNLEELSEKMHRCDVNKPYVFISYSSKDSEIVWNDVCYLQDLGYNIWIDKNLKETDETWETALDAIKFMDCKLIVFYMSKNSVVSANCLKELECRSSEEARNYHNGKEIPLVAIEVEPIEDIRAFRDSIFEIIQKNSEVSRDEKNEKAKTLSVLMDRFFPDNKKIRIKGQNDITRRYDYYKKIEENLIEAGVVKFNDEEMYTRGIEMLCQKNQNNTAIALFERCATEWSYLPAILMMAIIYEISICGEINKEKAKEQYMWATFQLEDKEWMNRGYEFKCNGQYAQAVAFFLASGLKNHDINGFLEASKMWVKVKNASYEFAKMCAEEAAKLGSEEGKRIYEGLRDMSESKFMEYAKTVR